MRAPKLKFLNYYEWNKLHRPSAAQHLVKDTRPSPRPLEPVELGSQVRPVCPVGGITLFSSAQLPSSLPNTSGKTRFSIDFRTVNVDNDATKRGAPNLDSACSGTSLKDLPSCERPEAYPRRTRGSLPGRDRRCRRSSVHTNRCALIFTITEPLGRDRFSEIRISTCGAF